MRMIRSLMQKLCLMVGIAVAAIVCTGTANAQAEDANAQIAEIIVTASRRAENVQKVPAAITAISSDQLEARGISDTRGLEQVTPGLNFSQSLNAPQPTIRGIGGRGVSPGDESTVPIYIDGIYHPSLAGSIFELNNIERVEVLKGPQSTLLGRNAIGGAINIITKTPQGGFSGDLSASYGRFDERVLKGYVAGGSDVIAADLAVVTNRSDGYIRNIADGTRLGDRRADSERIKVQLSPSPSFTATLALSHSSFSDNSGFAYHVLNGNTVGRRFDSTTPLPTAPYTVSLNTDPYNKFRQYAAALTLVKDFDAFSVTSLSSIQNNRVSYLSDGDGTTATTNFVTAEQSFKPLMQEIYAVSSGTRQFSWIVGASYYRNRSRHDPAIVGSTDPVTRVSRRTVIDTLVGTDAYAAYAQGRLQLTPELAVTAGGRYTSETSTRSGRVNSIVATGRKTFREFTPAGTIEYQIDPDTLIYFKASEGFKSGLFNASGTTQSAVEPEYLTQYEIGFKTTLGELTTLNIAAYRSDYKDLQVVSRNDSGGSQLLNAARAKLRGAEAELQIHPARGLDLYFGAAYIHGRYANYPDAVVTVPNGLGGNSRVFRDATGNALIRTPEWSFSSGIVYSTAIFNGEFVASANVNYQSKQFWEPLNRLVAPSRTIGNAEISWETEGGRFGAALWAENLFNENYQLTFVSSPSLDAIMYAKPRTFGVTISTHW